MEEVEQQWIHFIPSCETVPENGFNVRKGVSPLLPQDSFERHVR